MAGACTQARSDLPVGLSAAGGGVDGDGREQDDRGPDGLRRGAESEQLQVVRDDDDRDALVPEPADEAEHDPGLGDAQGEGWPQTAGQ